MKRNRVQEMVVERWLSLIDAGYDSTIFISSALTNVLILRPLASAILPKCLMVSSGRSRILSSFFDAFVILICYMVVN